ncbi:hypothetical protein PTKIN_Ptkin10aG0083800 [Pterospermum kingtungense]
MFSGDWFAMGPLIITVEKCGEDMKTSRTTFKLDQDHPGLDLASEIVATSATDAIAFKPYNSSYSNLLLLQAK